MKAIGSIVGCALLAGAVAACSAPGEHTVLIVGAIPSPGGTSAGAGGAGAVSDPPPSFMPDAAIVIPPPPGSTNRDASAAPTVTRDGGAIPSTDAGGGTTPGVPAAGTGLPCDVATMLAQYCLSCHNNPPLPSALAPLVTLADLKASAKEDPAKNEAQLSVARMMNATAPMPPGALPPSSTVTTLQNWINAGYPTGSCGTGGSGTAADGGTPIVIPPPPSVVFQNAPAFVARNGPSAHNAGRECMGCHRNGNGDAPQFSLGGTLYDANGRALGGAEVRLVDANGGATSAYTASNGTFYVNGSGFAAPAHIGVRNAAGTQEMFTPLQSSNGGACSSCHCTGGACTVGLVHLP